jgi:tetratricopeptide (TPR) repeat protein/TolB-like protein
MINEHIMRALRNIIITVILFLWVLTLHGCVSQSPSPGRPEGVQESSSKAQSGGTFFRHRWWNYYQRGISFAEDRQWSQALADFSAAIGQRDGDQRMARTYGMHFIDYFPSRELGVLYFENGRYQEAQEVLESSIASYPSAKALFYLDQVRRAIINIKGQSVAPPHLELSFTAKEVWTREDPVVIQGTAWDDHFISGVSINADPLYMDAGSQKNLPFQSLLHLPEGRHEIVVEAANLMGLTTQRAVTINVDRHGPLIAVEQIIREVSGQSDVYDIRGRITDAASVLKISLNDTPTPIQSAPEVPFQYRLPVSEKRIRIEAVDRLGNGTTADIEIQKSMSLVSQPILLAMAGGIENHWILASILADKNRQPPEIVLKGWQDKQTVYLEKIYLDGVVSDQDSVVQLTINDLSIISRPAKIAYFNHIMPLVEGINTISVKAADSNGNQSEKRITIIRKIPEALTLDARLKVTVLPFEKQGDLSAASVSFQTHMLDALYRQNRFRLVERKALDVILQEQKLSQTALMDQKTALRVGRLAAAQSIIAGDIIETRQGIEIVSRMIDTETSDILALEDVYSETKDRQSMQTLANGMAIKYHRDFPLVGGIVVSRKGRSIITDLGAQEIKLQRRILVYKESPIQHPTSGKLLGVDKEILCRARVTMVDAEISRAELLEDTFDKVRELQKVITE